jgi:hypothetical protein
MQCALFELDSVLVRFPCDRLAAYVLRVLALDGTEDPGPSDSYDILYITEFLNFNKICSPL